MMQGSNSLLSANCIRPTGGRFSAGSNSPLYRGAGDAPIEKWWHLSADSRLLRMQSTLLIDFSGRWLMRWQ